MADQHQPSAAAAAARKPATPGTGIDLVFRCASADQQYADGMEALAALRTASNEAGTTKPGTPGGGKIISSRIGEKGLDIVFASAIEDQTLRECFGLRALAHVSAEVGLSGLRPPSQPSSLPSVVSNNNNNSSSNTGRRSSSRRESDSLPPLAGQHRKGSNGTATSSMRATPDTPAGPKVPTPPPLVAPTQQQQSGDRITNDNEGRTSSSNQRGNKNKKGGKGSSSAALDNIQPLRPGSSLFYYKKSTAPTGEGLTRVFNHTMRTAVAMLREGALSPYPPVAAASDASLPPEWQPSQTPAAFFGIHLLHDACVETKRSKPYRLVRFSEKSVWNPIGAAQQAAVNIFSPHGATQRQPLVAPLMLQHNPPPQSASMSSALPPLTSGQNQYRDANMNMSHTLEGKDLDAAVPTSPVASPPRGIPGRIRTADRIQRKQARLTKDLTKLQEMHDARLLQNERLMAKAAMMNGTFSSSSGGGGSRRMGRPPLAAAKRAGASRGGGKSAGTLNGEGTETDAAALRASAKIAAASSSSPFRHAATTSVGGTTMDGTLGGTTMGGVGAGGTFSATIGSSNMTIIGGNRTGGGMPHMIPHRSARNAPLVTAKKPMGQPDRMALVGALLPQ